MNRSFPAWTRSGLVLLLAGLAPVAAMAETPAGLSISGQWMRALTPGLPAAGYFTLANALDHPVQLVGAASPACGSLTLHQTMLHRTMSAMSAMDPDNPDHGVPMASMQPIAAVAVPAHGMIRFAPGSYHLMCEQPTGAVQPGHSIPVTLHVEGAGLEGGGSIAGDFPVRGPRGN